MLGPSLDSLEGGRPGGCSLGSLGCVQLLQGEAFLEGWEPKEAGIWWGCAGTCWCPEARGGASPASLSLIPSKSRSGKRVLGILLGTGTPEAVPEGSTALPVIGAGLELGAELC